MINKSVNPLQEYEKWHQHYNQDAANCKVFKMMPWHESVLSLFENSFQGKKILEVGCGNGALAVHLASHYNCDITGVDFSPESIRIAERTRKDHQKNNVRFMIADALELPFSGEAFDLVISCECLEHVPNPQKMLNELYRVLKKGGKIVLTTENYSNAYAYYIAFLKWRGKKFDSGSSVQPIEHFFVFWKVKQKFKIAGFQHLRTYSNEFVLLLLPSFGPDTFTIKNTKSKLLYRILKPFGRRFTYVAQK